MQAPSGVGRIEGATVVGIGLMLAAIGLFSILNGTVKYLTLSHDPLMVAWARSVGALAFMVVVFWPRHGVALLRPNRPKAQMGRGVLLLGSTVLYFFGLSQLDMATGAAIQLTGPLMVTALSAPLLGEKVGWRRWSAVAVGFVGALIVIRPGFDMQWAALFFVASAVCSTFYQISTRYLAAHDHPATAATATAAVATIVLSPIAPLIWSDPEGALTIFLFCLLGVLAGFGHFLLTSAYRYAGASTLAPFSYAHLVGAAVIGYFVFGDFPDRMTWLGAGIIVAAGLYVAHREAIHARNVSRAAKTD